MRPAKAEDSAVVAKNGVFFMRITGGKARGIPIKAPSGQATRPATDRMRESVFSSLGLVVESSHCLDLFAGTGAYGLEALSRGAKTVTFVENNAKVLRVLDTNKQAVLKSLKLDAEGSTQTAQADVFRWKPAQRMDLIFADPPYSLLEKQGEALLKQLALWLEPTPGARIILEAPGGWQPADIEGIKCIKRLGKKGKLEPSVLIYKRQADSA